MHICHAIHLQQIWSPDDHFDEHLDNVITSVDLGKRSKNESLVTAISVDKTENGLSII